MQDEPTVSPSTMNRQCGPAPCGPVRYGHTAGFTRVNRTGYRRLDEDYRRMRIYYRKKCQHAWWFNILCKIFSIIRKITHVLAMVFLNILYIIRDIVRVVFKIAETTVLVPLQFLAAIGYFVARHTSKCNRYRCIALRPFLASYRLGGVFTHSYVDDAHRLIRWPGANNFRPVYPRQQFRPPPNLTNCSGCNKQHESEQKNIIQQAQQQVPSYATTIIAPQFGAASAAPYSIAPVANPPMAMVPYAAPPVAMAPSLPLSSQAVPSYPRQQTSYRQRGPMMPCGPASMRGGMLPAQYNNALRNELRMAHIVNPGKKRHRFRPESRWRRWKLRRRKQPIQNESQI